MTPAELAALGVRLAALVLHLRGLMWACNFVVTGFMAAYASFSDNFGRSLILCVGAAVPTAVYLLLAQYLLRRVDAILEVPAAEAASGSDRRTAELFVAAIVVWAALSIVDPLRQVVVGVFNAWEFADSLPAWHDLDFWDSAWMNLYDLLAAMFFLFFAKHVVRGILWIKRRGRAFSKPIAQRDFPAV